MEGRLNGMQTQLDDLARRMGGLNDCVGDLTRHTGNLIGELTGSITSLTNRIADIELILHRPAGTANASVVYCIIIFVAICFHLDALQYVTVGLESTVIDPSCI
jgi:hypothetical protein